MQRTGNLTRPWLVSAFLVLAVLAVYLPVVHLGFLTFDDDQYVTRNAHVQGGLTWAGLSWAFAQAHASNWHPVTWLSHMLDCQVYGLNPAGHHLTNLLFHAANTVLLFLWLRSLTGAVWRSALVAALFGVHPLHVESVAWVAERKDVLSAFFGLLSLWAYSEYARQSGVWSLKSKVEGGPQPIVHAPRSTLHAPRLYALSLLFFALGLMSKPMLVTWPCVMLLLDYWPLRRLGLKTQDSRLKTLRGLVLEKLPFFALSGAASVATLLAQKSGGAVVPFDYWPLGKRLTFNDKSQKREWHV